MIKILDCTLRDGGYVNDWEFSRDSFDKIIIALQEADVDFIEIGMMVKNNKDHFTTKFPSFDAIPKIPRIDGSRSLFTVMFTMGEAKGIDIPPRSADGVECIRLAYFKPDYEEALKLAAQLQTKGYVVFLQAMATFMYNDDELKTMLESVNKLQPHCLCMVDSFGVMYNDDVCKMYDIIDKNLDAAIGLGFHAHNNQQMALSNAITFIKCAENSSRLIDIDASVYGMGRGAGNVNLELLMNYMNQHHGTHYDANKILTLWNDYLRADYDKYHWGYTWEYFLSAKNATNSAYIWYIKFRGITDMPTIKRILDEIPAEWRFTLKRDIADELIAKYKGNIENA